MPTQPTAHHIQQLQSALLDAFDHAALIRLVRYGLDIDLEWIALVQDKRDMTTLVTDLVVYCASLQDGLKHLLAAACKQNPNSPQLTLLAGDWNHLEFAPLPMPEDHPAIQADQRGVAVAGNLRKGVIVTGDGNTVHQTETKGGSSISGNVEVTNGDFIGRDKITNILGLTREQTWLLIAILVGVLITIILILKILAPPSPPTPLTGNFIIGVAEISNDFHLLSWNPSIPKLGSGLGDEIYDLLYKAVQETKLDFLIGIGEPARVGSINGNGTERITQARQLAQSLNANMLVFGTLTPDIEKSIFIPELYIAPGSFSGAEEATDYFALEPIQIEGNIATNPVSKNELQERLISRVEEFQYLSIGLGYLEQNVYQQAADYFQRAYNVAYKLQTTKDRTAVLLMLGITAKYLGYYQEAYSYYAQAVEIDPNYARAYLGKGQMLFLIASKNCSNKEINRSDIQHALTLYTQAESLTTSPNAEVPSKAALFRAQAYTCLADADDKAEDWAEARLNYERVLHNYEANPSPLLRDLAAEASAGLGVIILRKDVQHSSSASDSQRVDALASFEQAAEWTYHPQRRAIFLLWQVILHLMRNDCTQAQTHFLVASKERQNYIQKNPSQPDKTLENLYTEVQTGLHSCSIGDSK